MILLYARAWTWTTWLPVVAAALVCGAAFPLLVIGDLTRSSPD